jgi:ribosome maturation factor RimP
MTATVKAHNSTAQLNANGGIMSIPRIQAALMPVFSAAGVDLEDLSLTKAGRTPVLHIVIDADDGIDLDTIAAVSRDVSQILDADDMVGALPDGYVLEVGSPGTDRPLTEERHWRRAAKRRVDVHPIVGEAFTDRVVGCAEGMITFENHAPLAVADVDSGLVQLEFGR